MKLEAQVTKVAKGLNRQPIMDALAAAVRKATPRPQPSPLRQVVRPEDVAAAQAKVRRTRRSSRVGFRRYSVLKPDAPRRHNARTWTRFMLETIVAHTDTRAATDAHRTSGQYPEKTLDFNWSVKQGYIEYI